MLYTKNGQLVDSSRYLTTSEGRVVYNATPEQWKAEGWVPYVPTPSREAGKSLHDLKLDVKEDARRYRDSILDYISKEERTFLRIFVQDLLDNNVEFACIPDHEDVGEVSLKVLKENLIKFNLVEYRSYQILQMHLSALDKIENDSDLMAYDYTADYPEVPVLF